MNTLLDRPCASVDRLGGVLPLRVRWQRYKLASLWDMLSTYGAAFLGLLADLRRVELLMLEAAGGELPTEVPRSLEDIQTPFSELGFWLTVTEVQCQRLGLTSAEEDIRSLRAILDDSDTKRDSALRSGEIRFRVMHLRELVANEFKAQHFYPVTATRAHYFDDPHPFGAEVQDRYPKASVHIVEAGKCLALDRSTAAVFHLMCVLEFGLESVAAALNIANPKDNWGALLNQIGAAIENIGPDSGAEWRTDRAFYSEVAQEIRFFKDAWRNHVAHGKATYAETQAASIFEHVKAFMQKIAAKLHEPP